MRLAGCGSITSFQIHGELFHLQGSLELQLGQLLCFTQLFFFDSACAAVSHYAQHSELNKQLLQQLRVMLRDVYNLFIDMHISAQKVLQNNDNTDKTLHIILNLQMCLIMKTSADQHRENLPISNEVSLIIQNDEYSSSEH